MGSGRYTAVPSIDGLTKDTAVTALQDAGLSPEVQGQYSDAQPIDTVIGTDPASGSRVTKGSTVALLTSLGRPTVPPIPAGGDVSALGAQLADRTRRGRRRGHIQLQDPDRRRGGARPGAGNRGCRGLLGQGHHVQRVTAR